MGGVSLVKSQTLDQSQLNSNNNISLRNLPGYSLLQSFTCGITGTLVEIDMGVSNAINGVGTLKIYSGSDTSGVLLQTTPVTINCPSGCLFTNFTTSVPVASGQIYTFRFTPGTGISDPYIIRAETPGTYAGGQIGYIDPSLLYYTGDDLVFKTFVNSSNGISTIDTYNSNIKIFPNPFVFQTTLQADKILKGSTLTVYNSLGQQVKQIRNISGQTITLYRDNLPSGLYFIRLMLDNKTFSADKLVITDK